ncbi:putative zinc-binding metallopeptidase [Pseudomonadota bacterium]
MKRFKCRCGERVFFENTWCLACGVELGFDPATLQMMASDSQDEGGAGHRYKTCRNRSDFGLCNWLVDAGSSDQYCVSCRLNRTIPHLDSGNNLQHWATLEKEKRRLLYSLIDLGLTVQSKARGWPDGLAFDFIEDQRSNPTVPETFVSTGHQDGVITINVAEADPLYRLRMQLQLGEIYRTVLGHFRHESGHYYFSLLLGEHNTDEFRNLFGDERTDYALALDAYYRKGIGTPRGPEFISSYASTHPLEDWAECWAHFLLIWDGLETTCAERGVEAPRDIDEIIEEWIEYAIHFNQTARSLGVDDPYPFVLTEAVRRKLRFVNDLIRGDNVASVTGHPVTG